MKYAARKLVALAAVAVLGTALASGCSSQAPSVAPSATAEKTVKIGFAAPLTGDNAIYGQGMQRAATLAIAEANTDAAVQAAHFKFELAADDDMGDPKQAVNVANLLVGDTRVVAVVGHFNSGCSIPASPVYDRANLAMVTVSSNPALTANGLPNVDRIVAKDDAQGAAAGELVATKLGLKSVAVIDDSTPYGQGLAAQFVKAFEAKGGTVTLQENAQADDVDLNAIVTRMKARRPQAIYFAGGLNQGALLSKQAKEAGLKVPLIGGDMIYASDYIKVAGKDNAEGDIATALGLPIAQQPKGKEFLAKYTSMFNEDPQAYDSYAYDATKIIVQAVLASGSTDRATVEKAIRNISYHGVTGDVAFDGNGDNRQQIISEYKVTSGKWTQLR